MFLYRDDEIQLLEDDFIKANSTLTFMFGRRKVGKTTLINNYIKNKNALYLSCFEAVNPILINSLKKSINEFFDINTNIDLKTFEELFIYLSDQKIENKIVIVLENINDFLKVDKNFVSNFYKYWNKYLKHKNIQFIITSSYRSSNKDDVSIFNKADNLINLKSISFNFLNDLFPNKTNDELLLLYSAFGTNLEYLKMYNTSKTFEENIKDNFLSYDSFLFNEGMNLIKNDLSDAVTYCSILYSIAIGNKKIGDIASFLNLKSSYITRYLQKLVDLMLISKSVPLNENLSKSKFGRYELEDNFLKFWFSYVYPNSSLISSNKTDKLYEIINIDMNKRLILGSYKKLISEKIEINEEEVLGFSSINIGSWWNNKDVEIDFVAYNSREILFIDCKIDKNNELLDYNILKDKSSLFNTPLSKNYLIIYKNENIETKG